MIHFLFRSNCWEGGRECSSLHCWRTIGLIRSFELLFGEEEDFFFPGIYWGCLRFRGWIRVHVTFRGKVCFFFCIRKSWKIVKKNYIHILKIFHELIGFGRGRSSLSPKSRRHVDSYRRRVREIVEKKKREREGYVRYMLCAAVWDDFTLWCFSVVQLHAPSLASGLCMCVLRVQSKL